LKAIEKEITYLEDGASFVIRKVKDGLEFVFTLQDKVLRVALKTLGAVFKVCNWLLKLVGIDLRKILAWLGHLLGWDDIWNTHKVFAKLVTNALASLDHRAAAEAATWRAGAMAALKAARAQAKSLVLSTEFASQSLDAISRSQAGQPAMAAAHTPQGNYVNYQIRHGGALDGAVRSALPATPGSLQDLATSVIIPALGRALDDILGVVEKLADILANPDRALSDLAGALAGHIDLVFDLVETLVEGVLDCIPLLVSALREGLTGGFDIPFLGALYEFITDILGDEEEFTILNGVCLLFAIPVVVTCKIAGFGAPFSDDDHGFTNPALFDQLAPPPAAPAHHVPLAAMMQGPAPMVLAATGGSSGDEQYVAYGAIFSGLAGMAAASCALFQGESIVATRVGLLCSTLRFAGIFPVYTPPFKTAAWCVGLCLTAPKLCVSTKWRGALDVVRGLAGLILSMLDDAENRPHELVWSADVLSNDPRANLGRPRRSSCRRACRRAAEETCSARPPGP
jgi:hypothetical protein